MKELRLISTILIGIFCLTNCITPYEPEDVKSTAGLLVVEGKILEQSGTYVQLSRTKSINESDKDYEKIDNANVKLLCSNGQEWNLQPKMDEGERVAGTYILQEEFLYDMTQTYAFDIKINGSHYQSEFVTPIKTPEISDVKYKTEDNGTQVNILVSTQDPNNEVLYYRWDCQEDWELVTKHLVTQYWDPDRKEVMTIYDLDKFNLYYCWTNRDPSNFALGSAKEHVSATIIDHTVLELEGGKDTRFTYLYSVLVKQYGIDKKAHTYFSQVKSYIEEMGGLFAPQPTDLKGNIYCLSNPEEKVIGYVFAATETSRRLFIDAKDVPEMKYIYPQSNEQLFPPNESMAAYNAGLGILYSDPDGYYWINRRCVDCRALGGTKNKPEWWPTDHN